MTDMAHGEVLIVDESHIVTVRKVVREAATRLGFGITDVTRIVTAASELSRNAFAYAGSGVMRWRALDRGPQIGLELVFSDHGPGIAIKERERVFDWFFQGERGHNGRVQGSGLGLAIARDLVL
ncbi:MAG: ATP-binding protein, partial [Anaerolineales bacterium]